MNASDQRVRSGTPNRGSRRALALVLAAALLVASTGGLLTQAAAKAAPGPLFNVQISVQTQSTLPDYFVVSAYNSTGALVTTSQSQYPAGSLQLPSGTYTLTATATVQSSYYQPYPAYSGGGVASAVGAPAQSASSPSVCCIYSQPLVEYGYLAQNVASSTTVTIPTRNINDTSSSAVTIKASFPDGTVGQGAYVSASVLGNWYWGYGPKGISMYNTTNAAGSATLVTPNVPLIVSVWASVPVNLPANQTTIQRTIAGEKINVTLYWQPTYVSFAGWSLTTPPQPSVSVVLHYQQPMYYVTPYGSKTGGGGAVDYGNGVPVPAGSAAPSAPGSAGQGSLVYPDFGPGGISLPAAQSQSTQTIYVSTVSGSASTTTTTTSSSGSDTLLLVAVGAAVALAVFSVLFVAVRSRRN